VFIRKSWISPEATAGSGFETEASADNAGRSTRHADGGRKMPFFPAGHPITAVFVTRYHPETATFSAIEGKGDSAW
jgi:hypothetical protein